MISSLLSGSKFEVSSSNILKLNQLKHYQLFLNVNIANILQKNKWPYKIHSSVICKICYESEFFLNTLFINSSGHCALWSVSKLMLPSAK